MNNTESPLHFGILRSIAIIVLSILMLILISKNFIEKYMFIFLVILYFVGLILGIIFLIYVNKEKINGMCKFNNTIYSVLFYGMLAFIFIRVLRYFDFGLIVLQSLGIIVFTMLIVIVLVYNYKRLYKN